MKKIVMIIISLCSLFNMSAQGVDDVTLVVTSSGETKEEATTIALRSAIEQAFGVFVSANTTILNDELVKDEIATVASGNVKSYTELESAVLPNGRFAVTLQAVVSTQRLALYAKSKGSICEFAGATLAANRRLMELNKINTQKAFDNLRIQLLEIAPFLFDHSLTVGEPAISDDGKDYVFPIKVQVLSNENTVAFVKLINSTIKALAISEYDVQEVKKVLGEVGKATVNSRAMYFPCSTGGLLKDIVEMTDCSANNFVIVSNYGTTYERCAPKRFWSQNSFNINDGFNYPAYMGAGPLFKKKKTAAPKEHVPSVMYASQTSYVKVPVGEIDKLTNLEIKQKYDVGKVLRIKENILEYMQTKSLDTGFLIYSDLAYWISVHSRGRLFLEALEPDMLINNIAEINCEDSSAARATITRFISYFDREYLYMNEDYTDEKLLYQFSVNNNGGEQMITIFDFENDVFKMENKFNKKVIENHGWIQTEEERYRHSYL